MQIKKCSTVSIALISPSWSNRSQFTLSMEFLFLHDKSTSHYVVCYLKGFFVKLITSATCHVETPKVRLLEVC